jgi:GNAT superfamily N-acetyltransferase
MILPICDDFLYQTLGLVNRHIESVVPGWGLTGAYFRDALERRPQEYIVDPWVRARKNLCAVEGERVAAAAHLLAFQDGPQVSDSYRGAGEIAWLVFEPGARGAAEALMMACRQQMQDWQARVVYAWSPGLPAPVINGIAESWPHVEELFCGAGFAPAREEAVFGGRIDGMAGPGEPPLSGLSRVRRVGQRGTSFAAVLDGREVGHCDCISDLTELGMLPTLRGWGEIAELWIEANQRGRGIGAWLVRHAVQWLRLGGCERVVLSVDGEDEAAGAGRFYRRFGWDALARQQVGWKATADS